MASTTGKKKWEKYFMGSHIETTLCSKDQFIPVYHDQSGNAVKALVLPDKPIKVPQAPEYSARYMIEYEPGTTGFVSQKYVKKPLATSGASENLGIKTYNLIDLGKPIRIEWKATEYVDVSYFDNHVDLGESIIQGCKDNPNITKPIMGVIESILAGNTKFEWGGISQTDRNELGKYIGEMIYPYRYSMLFDTPVAFPIDPAFNGVDSFILGKDEIIGVSSKYGTGAAASLFSNILPSVTPSEDSVLGRLAGLPGSPREKVYGYASRYYFRTTTDLFQSISEGKDSPDLEQALCQIRSEPDANPRIIEKLPQSMTAYISDRIVSDLGLCHASMDQINKIVTSNGYRQVTLDNKKWSSGIIDYTVRLPEDYTVQLTSGKSAISDLRAKQGIINYRLVPNKKENP